MESNAPVRAHQLQHEYEYDDDDDDDEWEEDVDSHPHPTHHPSPAYQASAMAPAGVTRTIKVFLIRHAQSMENLQVERLLTCCCCGSACRPRMHSFCCCCCCGGNHASGDGPRTRREKRHLVGDQNGAQGKHFVQYTEDDSSSDTDSDDDIVDDTCVDFLCSPFRLLKVGRDAELSENGTQKAMEVRFCIVSIRTRR